MKRLALLSPFLLLAACATVPVSPRAAAIPSALLDANTCAPHVIMSGSALIENGGERISARAVVLVSRPHRLRVTLGDPLGTTWFLATANEDTLFYAAPADGVRETLPRRDGRPVRLMGERYWPEDLIGNLPPCLDPALLKKGETEYENGELRQKAEDARRRWDFYPDGRIKSLLLIRPGAPPARFDYRYGEAGGFAVQINGKVKFTFLQVAAVPPPEAAAFAPPGGN